MKTYTFLLIIQLNKLQTKTKIQLRDTDRAEQIQTVCNKMTFRLQNHRERTVKIRLTPNVKKMT